MIYVIIIFLLISIYLYCLLGGADFGAGIVEFFTFKNEKDRIRKSTSEAIAPIWEANHMWVVIAVVILFEGFPNIYTQVSISLYIPLILLLIGIVLRGSAFVFRHYDAVKDESQLVYSKVFEISSVMVTFFFGLVIGALISGKIITSPQNFVDAYIVPWFNIFSISIGVFLCALFSFIASVYLIGDTTEPDDRILIIRKAKHSTITVVAAGALVFISSFIEQVGLAERFFTHPVSIAMILIATAALPLLWKTLSEGSIWKSRILAGAQLLFILGGFYAIFFPTVVSIKDSQSLTLFNSAAPQITLNYLGWALIVGSFIIFPALFYLFKVFKFQDNKEIKTD
jgi:cytochrome bd ubiquinol oxidase subunit II